MNEELKSALDGLAEKLEGKSNAQIEKALESFEAKHKEAIENEVKSVYEAEISELKEQLKATQDHANKLDVKLQKKSTGSEAKSFNGVFAEEVKSNFDSIKQVRKGQGFKMEIKDMTLGGNLTGDQPRDYQSRVASIPMQKVNFADLVGLIPIEGGTYTIPRETAPTGSAATQTEGAAKAAIDYNITMVDVNTDFIAGLAVYSKKMANNLPFLTSWVPTALQRDYYKAENSAFYTELSGLATASTLTEGNIVERIFSEMATLEALDYTPNGVVVNPADYNKILVTRPGTDNPYSLPGAVTFQNGVLAINGLPVYKASWIPADRYIIGDWSFADKVVTEGLGVEFSSEDSDNFRKNNITARAEAQVALAVQRPDAFIFGDFTATV